MDRGEGRHQDPQRGSLLVIDGEKDDAVPSAIASASFERQERDEGVTEMIKSGTAVDSLRSTEGFRREIADAALSSCSDLLREP